MTRAASVLTLTLVIISALVSGCLSVSTERIRTQVLQPTDSTLPAVSDQLVTFDVSIHNPGSRLKLYSAQVYNLTTGEPWSLAFFENSFIDSKAIHGEIDNETVRHTVITNLPAATYQLKKIKFTGGISRFEQGNLTTPDISQSFEHGLTTPLFFTVEAGAGPQYLGELEIRLNTYAMSSQRDFESSALAASQAGNMAAIAANAMHTEIQTLGGTAHFQVHPPTDESIASMQTRYPATASMSFTKGRMWQE